MQEIFLDLQRVGDSPAQGDFGGRNLGARSSLVVRSGVIVANFGNSIGDGGCNYERS